jgi:hypothetical protein
MRNGTKLRLKLDDIDVVNPTVVGFLQEATPPQSIKPALVSGRTRTKGWTYDMWKTFTAMFWRLECVTDEGNCPSSMIGFKLPVLVGLRADMGNLVVEPDFCRVERHDGIAGLQRRLEFELSPSEQSKRPGGSDFYFR